MTTQVGPELVANTSSRVVASDHTTIGIPRKVRVHTDTPDFDVRMRQAIRNRKAPLSGRIFRYDLLLIEEVEKWLLNYARNANKPTPVVSAITTKKANAPRRLAPMRLLNHITSHQKTRKIEFRLRSN